MDYSRIFQFQNFKRSRKRVMDSLEEGPGVAPGTLVTIHISNVPRAAYGKYCYNILKQMVYCVVSGQELK